ncbi:hypothetical protein OKW11_003879 [Pseudomonas baetica]|nr:hypothetical protein [Pseudomonas baetica]
MANAAHSHNGHDSHDAGHGSVKSYAIGFILSVILTLIPFGLVMYPTLPKVDHPDDRCRVRSHPGAGAPGVLPAPGPFGRAA